MGEPRQRNTHPRIIDKPELKSPLRHFTEGSITITLWVIWIYWLLPILTLFLWVFGFRLLYQLIFTDVDLNELAVILNNGGMVILVIFTLQILWVYYNFYIFRKVGERRKTIRAYPEDKFAAFFGLDVKYLEELKKSNKIEVTLKENHKLVVNSHAKA